MRAKVPIEQRNLAELELHRRRRLELESRNFGKLEMTRRNLGSQVINACGPNGGPREFMVATTGGLYRVKVTKVRQKKAKIILHGCSR